jgi:predicted metal-binding membrane protein
MKQPADRRFAFLEYMLRRERLLIALVLLLIVSLSWLWIAAMAGDMYGSMIGPAAWMMTPAWDTTHLLLLWAMWAVMMVAMMLPSASSTLLLYLHAARIREEGSEAALRVYALAGGYLSVWAVFSIGATLLQRVLATREVLSPMMEPASTVPSALLLLIAGAYQMTPLKRVCLRSCRSPLSFLMRRWRPGWTGAYRMGVEHGVYCLGCCWALMLLLFAGGVMNLAVIAALTAWILVEKLLPAGEHAARVSGVLLIGTAVWMLAG